MQVLKVYCNIADVSVSGMQIISQFHRMATQWFGFGAYDPTVSFCPAF